MTTVHHYRYFIWWLSTYLDRRSAGHHITPDDDPITYHYGYHDHEDNTVHLIAVTNVREAQAHLHQNAIIGTRWDELFEMLYDDTRRRGFVGGRGWEPYLQILTPGMVPDLPPATMTRDQITREELLWRTEP